MTSLPSRIKRRAIRQMIAIDRAAFLKFVRSQFRLFGRAIFKDKYGLRYYVYPDADLSMLYVRKTLFDDPSLFSLLEKIIAPDDIVVDVGANVGLLTLYASRVAYSGHVYAIEPEQINVERLHQNLKLARCKNVTTEATALSDYTGIATLNVFSENRVLNSLGRPIIQTTEKRYESDSTQEVPVTTLDSFVQTHGLSKIDLLKVDVEGAEPRVLAGCKQLLSDCKIRHIVFEISQTPLRALGYTAHDTFDGLERYGYRIKRILPDGSTHTYERQGDADVLLANFLAVRPEAAT